MAPSPPDKAALHGFTLGATYTRDEIYAALGGSKRSAIPTVYGVVVAVCIRTGLNAKAPAEFLCGAGPTMVKTGNLLASTAGKLPVFTKQRVNHWQYRGLYGVAASHRVGPIFDAMVARSGRSPSSVSVAVELAQ